MSAGVLTRIQPAFLSLDDRTTVISKCDGPCCPPLSGLVARRVGEPDHLDCCEDAQARNIGDPVARELCRSELGA